MLLAFVLAVSFVHPFYGEISCAKEETGDLPGDAANTKTEPVADLPETDTEDGQKKGETKDLFRTTDQNGETETVTEENKKADKSEDTEEGREHKKEDKNEGIEADQEKDKADKSEDTEEGQEKDKADKSEDTEEVQEKEQEEDTCGTAKQETDQVQTEETVDGNAEETEKNPQDQKAPVTDDTADVPEEAAEGAKLLDAVLENQETRTEAETEMEEYEITEPGSVFSPVMRAAAVAGISTTDPQAGQENSYGCTGSVQIWTVPASGKYRITCYGGAGGAQSIPGDSLDGGRGSMRQGTISLEKGTVLYIYVGGNGLGGIRHSHGGPEGGMGGYNGGAAAGYDTNDLGNKGRYWTHGTGGGASDIRLGGNGLDHRIMVAGGGGGADKQTTGGHGDGGKYNGNRSDGSYEGGGGGYNGGAAHQGGSSYVNTSRFTDIKESNGSSQSGQVSVQVVSLFPQVKLTAPTAWTREDVTIRAEVIHEGEGRPEAWLSWETDVEGNALWTDKDTYTVSQNGTYACKIRDTAGNISERVLDVRNIDKQKPVIREIEVSDGGWTTGDITLTVRAEDCAATAEYGCSGLAEQAYLWGRRPASGEPVWGDGEEPESESVPAWTAQDGCTISENGTYLCRVRDAAGNVEESSHTVSNIDRTPPRLTCHRPETWYEGSTRVRLEAKDLQPDGSWGSGLAEAPFSTDGVVFSASPYLTVDREGTYEIWVKDRMGNVRKETFTFLYDVRASDAKHKHKDPGGTKKEEAPIPEIMPPEPSGIIPENFLYDEAGVVPEEVVPDQKENRDSHQGGMEPAPPQEIQIQPHPPAQVHEKKLPVRQKQTKETSVLETLEKEIPEQRQINWKKAALYTVWMAALLCGLVWLLFCLIFEHALVYRKDEAGVWQKIGRCAIVRKREYQQINLLHLMKSGEYRDYKVRFSMVFLLFHQKKKVMVRTCYGVELRKVKREIEILSCNSETPVLT